jgi:hypothetical protein
MSIQVLVAHSNPEVRKQVGEALDSLAAAGSSLSFVPAEVSDAANASSLTTAFDAVVIDSLLPTKPGAEVAPGSYAGLSAFLSKQTVVPPTLILVDVDPDAELRAMAQRIRRAQFLLPADDLKQALADLIHGRASPRRRRIEPSARIGLHFSLSNLSCNVEYTGGPYLSPCRLTKPLPIQYPNEFHKILERTRKFEPIETKEWSSEIEKRGSELFIYLRGMGLGEYYYAALKHCANRLERLQIHFEVDPGLDDVPLEHLVDYELSWPYFLMLRSPMTRSLKATERQSGSCSAKFTRSSRILCVLSDVADQSFAATADGAFPDVEWNEYRKLPGLEREREFFNKLKSTIPNVRILPDGEEERSLPLLDLLRREIGDNVKRKPRYDIVHFAGHGHTQLLKEGKEPRTFLILGRPGARYDPLPIETFVGWLRECGTRLIFLSACSTASPATAYAITRAGIPAVIGFRWKISDERAPDLMENFYGKLRARDVSIPEALRHAIWQVYLNGFAADPIWAAPMVVVPPEPERHGMTMRETLQ